MTTDPKFNNSDRIVYGQQFCFIAKKRFEASKNTWMYEVENKANKFKAWVTEDQIKPIN